MAFSFDTTESEHEEAAGWILIQEAIQRTEDILSSPEWTDPAPKSPLAEVDALTPYQPMSFQLRSFDMVAVDNLRATGHYIQKANDVPMMALHSMIRSAIESTSYGLWMLGAGGYEKKAFLSLRLSYENNEDVASLGRAFDPGAKSGQRTRNRLKELQQGLRRYKHRDIEQRATTTDVVANADKIVGQRRTCTGLQAWKSCSGLAHANALLMPVLLERKFTGDQDARGATFMLTSRLTVLGSFFIAAVENLEVMRLLYKEQSRPTH